MTDSTATGGASGARQTDLLIVLCTGMKRSASTWSYNVCRLLLEREARRRGLALRFTYCADTDALITAVAREVKASAQGRILLLKSHTPGPRTRKFIGEGKVANIFTLRDPRDAVASHMKCFPEFSEIGRRIRAAKRELALGAEFASGKRSLMVQYERMTSDPLAAVGRIARYLGCEAPEAVLREIHRATDMEASRQIAERVVAARKPGEGRRVDSATQIHENHVQGGIIGRWREELAPDVQSLLNRELGRWLTLFGYDRAA